MQMDIQETILNSPELVLALTVIILLAYQWQKGLTYHKYRYFHSIRVLLFRVLNPIATRYGRPLLSEKDLEGPEFVVGLDKSPREVYHQLEQNGFEPHLIATIKYRKANGRTQYTHSQLVYKHSDGAQTEVYLFEYEGAADIYSHVETGVTDPMGHLTDGQQKGDARDAVKNALETDVPR